GMESPVEQALFAAMLTIQRVNGLLDVGPIDTPHGPIVEGLAKLAQKRIGKYRADFLVSYIMADWQGRPYRESVIVECDSQEFHDRSERERRNEKRRDRFFQSMGYTVFHYTGKEILEDPFKVASEILSHVVPWAYKPDFFYDEAMKDMKVRFGS
ncbi:MAG: DUF559 domain-containing protein, partial [Acidobacteriota bacterium]